jgi:DNA-binding transcriptional LysR family regulator
MDRLALLQIFVDIHDAGSMAAVARQRNVAPSAITQALQQLEVQVDTTLVTRTTRRLRLTPEGERFLVDCRRILADIDDAIDHLRDDGPLRGTIRLTTTNDFGRTRLPNLIDAFLDQHPAVRIELDLSDGVVDLVDRRFDVAIRTGPLADSSFKARLLVRQRRLVCASPRYWASQGRPEHPRELASHNCLVLNRPGAPQNEWHFLSGRDRFSVKVWGNRTTNDGGALRQWAIRGAGVVLKAEVDVAEDLMAGRLESVLGDFTEEAINLYALYPGQRPPSRRVQALLDFLSQRLGH